MPRTLGHALWFLLGLWLALTLLGPIGARGAGEQDPELARLEADLYAGVNAFRTGQHLLSLERRPELDRVARAHSEDMVRRGFFAHQNPDGEMWWQRLERAGVTGFTMAGENVAQTNQAQPEHGRARGLEGLPRAPREPDGATLQRHRRRHRAPPRRPPLHDTALRHVSQVGWGRSFTKFTNESPTDFDASPTSGGIVFVNFVNERP